MSESQSVLAFIEEHEGKKLQPSVVTMERTKTSSYMFYLLVRHYRYRLKPAPRFIKYAKEEANGIQGAIEEFSIIDGDEGAFYVLEGFPQTFVDRLNPAPGTCVLAETDGGQLRAEPYSYYGQKRNILRALHSQLRMKTSLTLSALVKMDWSSMKSYDEYEPILRRAKLMGTTAEELEEALAEKVSGNVLTLTKRGQIKQLLEIAQQMGFGSFYSYLQNLLADLMHYRALRLMGYDERKCEKEMAISWRRANDLEEASKMLTSDDIAAFSKKLIGLDWFIHSKPELGIPILLGNSPINIRRS